MDICKGETFADEEGLSFKGFLEAVERPLNTADVVCM